jgi:8-oxo-dGTP pyrophosphatase MutT (NUDIX family)
MTGMMPRMTTWTLPRFQAAIRSAWGPDTCDPSDLADWHEGNPARGQCGPTALVLHDVFGGELILGEVYADGARQGFHWWNQLPDGTEVDLTREQFSADETVTTLRTGVQPTGTPSRCQGQYKLLRRRVLRPAAGAEPRLLAAILLADAGGALLLQHRDGGALAEPDQWGLPGGQIRPGETPQQAARRGLYAETGLRVPGELVPLWHGERPDTVDGETSAHWYVYQGKTSMPWPTLAVEEGQDAQFVTPDRVTEYDLGPTTAFVLWHHLRAVSVA